MFNTNLLQFFTGNTGDSPFGYDGASVISLPELLGIGKGVAFGGNYGSGSRTLQGELTQNFKDNWGQIAMGVIFIPVAANIIQKVIRKPVILPANRMLKSIGLKDVKL